MRLKKLAKTIYSATRVAFYVFPVVMTWLDDENEN
jgi:hypothetical protein